MLSNRSPYAPLATPLPASVAFTDSEANAPRLVIEVSEPATLARVTAVSVTLTLPPSVLAIAAATSVSIQVRASFPGCLVSPAEVTLDAFHSPSATLWLTPLALQPHFDGNLEIVGNGQIVQRLPMRIRANRGRLVLGLALAAIAAPLAWWCIAAANGAAVSATIREHVPAFGRITAAIASATQFAIDRVRTLEHHWPVGFWLGAGFAAAALASRWLVRPTARTITGDLLPNAMASPSSQMWPLPPYLTAVSSEELARPGH